MGINNSAPASATHEITINAPLEVIWNLITEITRWSAWNPAVSKAKLNGSFAPGTTFDWKSNGFAIHSTLQEIAPMSRLVWTGKALGTSAIHVWTFEAVGDGLRVRTAESFDGWLVKLMRGSMTKTLDGALTAWLQRLKQTAEGTKL
jgi:hypothetical protein